MLCYGINNAFEVFQRSLDQTIGHLPHVKCISDDIIIYNNNYADHIATLEKLFAKIKELGLRLNKRKCVFAKSSIAFFGVIISAEGVKPYPIKIESIQNATPPQNINELRSFLGLSTYLSRFIDNFSSKTAPLRSLLKKGVKFTWGKQQENSFEELKKNLISDQILGFFNPNSDTELVTDASDFGLGGVLLQRDENENQRPIAFISRSLTDTDRKYGITEKEALSVVWCVKKLHHYLFGKQFKLTVDHKTIKIHFQSSS